MFETVLVANRGEIAVRVLATLRQLGIRGVAVHTAADAGAVHVAVADEAVAIGSYLSISDVLGVARATGAQAVHPGYGFLAENPAFAMACADADVVFVGPPAAAIAAMGDKIAAKATVAAAGVPVVPGSDGAGLDDAALAAAALDVGLPVLLKPSAGGGGKGMREVHDAAELTREIAAARREARSSFGDDNLLVERLVARPRHIEVQVLADAHGAAVHLGERECSLQRRHQKVIEEAPSALLSAAQRERMGAAAVAAVAAVGYVGAGTVEFLVGGDDPDAFFFLECNTRLQVEHPVTEQVYGVNLVELQLRVAAGEPSPWPPRLRPIGHAIEARVYAEDPAAGFLPTGGPVLAWHTPSGEFVRTDAGIATGSVVGGDYDPMLAKVIAYGDDRAHALRRLDAALRDTVLLGLGGNVAFLRALLADPDVRAARLDTGLIARRPELAAAAPVPDDVLAAAAAHAHLLREPAAGMRDPFDVPDGWRVGEHAWTTWWLDVAGRGSVPVRVRGRLGAGGTAQIAVGGGPTQTAVGGGPTQVAAGDSVPYAVTARLDPWPTTAVSVTGGLPPAAPTGPGTLTVTLDGTTRRYAVAVEDAAGADAAVLWLGRDGASWVIRERPPVTAAAAAVTAVGPVVAPMPGTVTVVEVAEGDPVAAGDRLVVVEAMKMEHVLTAPVGGVVRGLRATAGATVARGEALLTVEPVEEPPEPARSGPVLSDHAQPDRAQTGAARPATAGRVPDGVPPGA